MCAAGDFSGCGKADGFETKGIIRREWGGRCFVIASGPSLQKEDVEKTRGKGRVIAVSDNYKIAPWADAMYSADEAWWDVHNGASDFSGRRFTQSEAAAERFGLEYIRVESKSPAEGLSTDPSVIYSGGNSGHQAIGLGFLLGCAEFILMGFDMGGNGHWFGPHPEGLRQPRNFANWIDRFQAMADDAATLGVTIINCSRDTGLTCFPRMSIEDAIKATARNRAA